MTQGPSAETTVIALGDVAGKGLEAARRASYVRTALAALCLTYRPSDGRVTWATAGHPAPLRLDDGRELEHDGRRAPPLGLTREIACGSGGRRSP